MKSKNLSIIKKDSLIYITFPNLEKGGCIAAFSTRMGGVSKGRYATMNLSFSNGDNLSNVKENYKILFGQLGLNPSKAVLSHQTHTDNIKIVTADDIGKGISKPRDYDDIDALITNCKGVGLVTQFADCVPLLFFDPVKKVVAAAHAGWRGTVKEIGKKTVDKMDEVFGSDPKDILAAIGPSICQDCYEVDYPVYEKFKNLEYIPTEKIFLEKENGKYMLDLWMANRLILENAGISPENITVTDLCTCCNSNYFHSHRATGGSRGNLAAIIALKEK